MQRKKYEEINSLVNIKQQPSIGNRVVNTARILFVIAFFAFFLSLVIPSLQSTSRYFEAALFVIIGLWWISNSLIYTTQFLRSKERIPWYKQHDLMGGLARLFGGLDAFVLVPSIITRNYSADAVLVIIGIPALTFLILSNIRWKLPHKEAEVE